MSSGPPQSSLHAQLSLELQLRQNCQELLALYKETQDWDSVGQLTQTLLTNSQRITALKKLLSKAGEEGVRPFLVGIRDSKSPSPFSEQASDSWVAEQEGGVSYDIATSEEQCSQVPTASPGPPGDSVARETQECGKPKESFDNNCKERERPLDPSGECKDNNQPLSGKLAEATQGELTESDKEGVFHKQLLESLNKVSASENPHNNSLSQAGKPALSVCSDSTGTRDSSCSPIKTSLGSSYSSRADYSDSNSDLFFSPPESLSVSHEPTPPPTHEPTPSPTHEPTPPPTHEPTPPPTHELTPPPTHEPTPPPAHEPTPPPTLTPNTEPTQQHASVECPPETSLSCEESTADTLEIDAVFTQLNCAVAEMSSTVADLEETERQSVDTLSDDGVTGSEVNGVAHKVATTESGERGDQSATNHMSGSCPQPECIPLPESKSSSTSSPAPEAETSPQYDTPPESKSPEAETSPQREISPGSESPEAETSAQPEVLPGSEPPETETSQVPPESESPEAETSPQPEIRDQGETSPTHQGKDDTMNKIFTQGEVSTSPEEDHSQPETTQRGGSSPLEATQRGGSSPPETTQQGGSSPPEAAQRGGSSPPETAQRGVSSPPETTQRGGISPPETAQRGGSSPPETAQRGGSSPPEATQRGGSSPPETTQRGGSSPPETSQVVDIESAGGLFKLESVPPQETMSGDSQIGLAEQEKCSNQPHPPANADTQELVSPVEDLSEATHCELTTPTGPEAVPLATRVGNRETSEDHYPQSCRDNVITSNEGTEVPAPGVPTMEESGLRDSVKLVQEEALLSGEELTHTTEEPLEEGHVLPTANDSSLSAHSENEESTVALRAPTAETTMASDGSAVSTTLTGGISSEVNEIPVETTPADKISPEATPVDEIPVEVTPADIISPEATPVDEIPVEVTLADRISREATPVETTLADRISPEAITADEFPTEAVSSETTSESPKPDDTSLGGPTDTKPAEDTSLGGPTDTKPAEDTSLGGPTDTEPSEDTSLGGPTDTEPAEDASLGSPTKPAEDTSLSGLTDTEPAEDAGLGSPIKPAEDTSLSDTKPAEDTSLGSPTDTKPAEDASLGSPTEPAEDTSLGSPTDTKPAEDASLGSPTDTKPVEDTSLGGPTDSTQISTEPNPSQTSNIEQEQSTGQTGASETQESAPSPEYRGLTDQLSPERDDEGGAFSPTEGAPRTKRPMKRGKSITHAIKKKTKRIKRTLSQNLGGRKIDTGNGDAPAVTPLSPIVGVDWDPTCLLEELYSDYRKGVLTAGKTGESARHFGYLQKLPMNKTKPALGKGFKRRYFRAMEGNLYYYEDRSTDKALGFVRLETSRVVLLPEKLQLQVVQKDNKSLMLKASDQEDLNTWHKNLLLEAAHPTQPLPSSPLPTSKSGVVIIDIGACSVRAGFASEDPYPELFFPAVASLDASTQEDMGCGIAALQPESRYGAYQIYPRKVSRRLDQRDASSQLRALDSIIGYVVDSLDIDPQGTQLVLTLSPTVPESDRNDLMELLFESYGFAGVCAQEQAILALYSYNTTSGIVVDIGDHVDIVPIIDGYVIEAGVTRLPFGGNAITESLSKLITARGIRYFSETESYIVRLIKESLCFVSEDYVEDIRECDSNPVPFTNAMDTDRFQLPDHRKVITLDSARFKATEGLFTPSQWGKDVLGLHDHIWKAVQACPIDQRRQLAKSIYLSGACTLLPGLQERLQKELSILAGSGLPVTVHAGPSRQHAAYIGASVLASLGSFSRVNVVSLEEWSKSGVDSLQKWKGT